ncbi:hypothetical protein DY000_02052764 [Brassica cretica]|uniref:Uncharacterized protein n=1 Tax=Brassica cretica TaxID=69181 RepID=A0ABQ7A5A2_BRACR|nr:hypothetical protein DY000_02052764 [Brassica cretica]
MAKLALRGDVCGKAVSWELGTTIGWWLIIDDHALGFLYSLGTHPGNTHKWSGEKREGRTPLLMAKTALKADAACARGVRTSMIREGTRYSEIKYKETQCVKECIGWKNKTDRFDWDIIPWPSMSWAWYHKLISKKMSDDA